MKLARLGRSTALLWLVLSCEREDGGASDEGACEGIIEHCHTKDDGSRADVAECHALAHEYDDTACAPRQKECSDLCDSVPTPGPTSASDTGETGWTEGTAGEETGGETAGDETAGDETGHEGTGSLCEWLATHCDGADAACAELGQGGDAEACEASLADCLPACGSSVCDFLGGFCHGKDETCHEVGHGGVRAECEAQLDACVDACGG